MFWIGLIIGLIIGAPFGIFILGLISASARNDKYVEFINKNNNKK